MSLPATLLHAALDINNQYKQNQQLIIEASKTNFYLADTQLRHCLSANQEKVIIQAKEGQIMNVSQINLKHDASNNNIYATIKDVGSNQNVLIGDGPRHKQLVVSSSHELELTLTEQNVAPENRFMLHIEGGTFLFYFQKYEHKWDI